MSHRCDSSHGAAVRVEPHIPIKTLSETKKASGNRLMGAAARPPSGNPFLLKSTDLKQDAAAQWHNPPASIHTFTYDPFCPPPPHWPRTAPHRCITHTHSPSLGMLIAPPWFTSFYWPAPLRGQVHCQSGWHIVFHSTNQQTAPWWVSTLVVKVTFDGWEGYGGECWGDSSRQLVP